MKSDPAFSAIHNLFSNANPQEVWCKAADIFGRIHPAYDFSDVHTAFNDVVSLYQGNYPGYGEVKTMYHDLPHTLDVFMCAVRLMHGVHISGTRLSDREVTLIAIASLMHDAGFAQERGTETGTGAQFLQTHVRRSIEFMLRYLAERSFPAEWAAPLTYMIQGTDLDLPFNRIDFKDERTLLLGQIVSTADLLGQMADRIYLEKLLLLHEEFKEAKYIFYPSPYDLLNQTTGFYKMVRQRLDGEYGGIYTKFTFHFKDCLGVERNFYLEATENNIAYLSKLTLLGEEKYLSMLKRARIAEKIRT